MVSKSGGRKDGEREGGKERESYVERKVGKERVLHGRGVKGGKESEELGRYGV